MPSRLISVVLSAVFLIAADLPTANAAEEGMVKGSAAWVGQGRIFKTGEAEAKFVGAFGGVLYVETADAKMDAMKLICPGTFDIDVNTGVQQGNGDCILIDKDNDNVFAEWTCDGQNFLGCEGSFTLTGGTGKFQGITGQSPVQARTAFQEIAVNFKSGTVIETSAGLLALTELTYKIP